MAVTDMRITTQEKFGLTPCTWQLQSAQYQLEKRDVVISWHQLASIKHLHFGFLSYLILMGS